MVPFPQDPNGKLKSGVIKILDSTSFFISKLNLWIEDEPGYRFWVGNSTTMKPDRGGFMVCLQFSDVTGFKKSGPVRARAGLGLDHRVRVFVGFLHLVTSQIGVWVWFRLMLKSRVRGWVRF